MARYTLPDAEFVPHPEGQHQGLITAVKDEGDQETPWGMKRKLSVRIESSTMVMEDGRPFVLVNWFTFSGASNSNLTAFRQSLAGRSLTKEERLNFDDTEILKKGVDYQVIHKAKEDGTIRAYLDSIRSLGNDSAQAASTPPQQAAQPDPEDLDHYLKMIDLMVENELISVDQGTAATDETVGIAPARLRVRVDRATDKLLEAKIPIPERQQAQEEPPPPNDDDLPF